MNPEMPTPPIPPDPAQSSGAPARPTPPARKKRLKKPTFGGYAKMDAEFRKSDGTVYTARWEAGAVRCNCTGFKYRRECKHAKALLSVLESL